LNGPEFSAKKLEIPLAPMVNRKTLERSRVTVTPPHTTTFHCCLTGLVFARAVLH